MSLLFWLRLDNMNCLSRDDKYTKKESETVPQKKLLSAYYIDYESRPDYTELFIWVKMTNLLEQEVKLFPTIY